MWHLIIYLAAIYAVIGILCALQHGLPWRERLGWFCIWPLAMRGIIIMLRESEGV